MAAKKLQLIRNRVWNENYFSKLIPLNTVYSFFSNVMISNMVSNIDSHNPLKID